MIDKLIADGKFKRARKLKTIYEETSVSKPVIGNVCPELDSRFVRTDLDNATTFDGWTTLNCLGHKLKIQIPFKKHVHFNKMLAVGSLKTGVRLRDNSLTFMFDIPDALPVETGSTIGIDIGQKTILTCSDGQVIDCDSHGHNYTTICQKLASKKKNSRAFNRTVTHRTNYINWSVKQLNLEGIKTVNRENIKHLRKGRNTSRLMKHWNYAELFEKLDNRLIESGVLLNKLNPTYTSQRCSVCGWVRKGNRKWKLFKCDRCGNTMDADLNASTNLSLPLLSISKQQRLRNSNRAGFYWNCMSQELIVPDTQRTALNEIVKFH